MKVQIVPHPYGGYAFHNLGDPADLTFGHFPTRERAEEIAAMNFYEVIDSPGDAEPQLGPAPTMAPPLALAILGGAILGASLILLATYIAKL